MATRYERNANLHSETGLAYALILKDAGDALQAQRLVGPDPIANLIPEKVDVLLNLSASPFGRTKASIRHQLAARAANRLNCPVIYVNLIANNGFNIFGSLMLGGYAAWLVEDMGISAVALPLFSIGLTVLVILLGEILPKAIGTRLALPVSLASAPVLHLLGVLMRPLVLLLALMGGFAEIESDDVTVLVNSAELGVNIDSTSAENDLSAARTAVTKLEGQPSTPEKVKAQQLFERARARAQASKST